MTDEEVAIVREAVIRENLRWEGLDASGPLPILGAAKVYVSDVERYVRVGIAALDAHRAARKDTGRSESAICPSCEVCINCERPAGSMANPETCHCD